MNWTDAKPLPMQTKAVASLSHFAWDKYPKSLDRVHMQRQSDAKGSLHRSKLLKSGNIVTHATPVYKRPMHLHRLHDLQGFNKRLDNLTGERIGVLLSRCRTPQ